MGREKWSEKSGAEESGTRKVPLHFSHYTFRALRFSPHFSRPAFPVPLFTRGEKSGARKVERRKVGREKWGEKSGAEESGTRKVGRQMWDKKNGGNKSRV